MTFGQWFLMQQMQGEGGGPSQSSTPPPSYFGGAQFDPNQNQGWSEPTPIPGTQGADPFTQLLNQYETDSSGFLAGTSGVNTDQVNQLLNEPASIQPSDEGTPFDTGLNAPGVTDPNNPLASQSPTFATDPSGAGLADSTLGAIPDPSGAGVASSSLYPDGQGGYAPLNLGDLPTSNLSDRPPGFYQNPYGSFGVGGEGGTLANEPNIGAGPQPGSLAGLGSFSGGDLGQYGKVVGRNIWDAKIPLTQKNYGNLQGYLNYNLGGFTSAGGRPQWVWDAGQNRFVKRSPQQGQGQQGGMTYAQYLQEWNALRQANATGGTQGGGEPGGGATTNVQGSGKPMTSVQ